MQRQHLFIGGVLLGLLLLFLVGYKTDVTPRDLLKSDTNSQLQQQENLLSGLLKHIIKTGSSQECPDTSQMTEQRSSLSRLLNGLKKSLGQLECNMAKLRNTGTVASSGGWCEEESDPKKSKAHMFDQMLADALSRFLRGQRVAGFGDGPGEYRRHLLQQGLVTSYEAYDGAPFCENVTGGAVRFMDLTLPQYGLPVYDWVVCLEVAEHVPARYERVLVDNIARHARQGVILSWARPGQGGFHHVNNKSPEDVKRLMDEAGFLSHDNDSLLLRNRSSFSWFKNNIMVFRRKSDAVLKNDAA